MSNAEKDPSRRRFLVSGGLIVGGYFLAAGGALDLLVRSDPERRLERLGEIIAPSEESQNQVPLGSDAKRDPQKKLDEDTRTAVDLGAAAAGVGTIVAAFKLEEHWRSGGNNQAPPGSGTSTDANQ